MADTLKFELVSPERRLASIDAVQVTIPGIAGDFAAMPGHAPFLTVLRPGIVSVQGSGAATEYVVSGGFAEVSGEGVSILAEEAVEKGKADKAMLDRLATGAKAALDSAGEETKAAAALRVNDVATLAAQLGF